MTRRLNDCLAACLLIIGLLGSGSAPAASVQYKSTNIAGSTWRYDYTLINDGPVTVDEWTVFFDPLSFSALSVVATPVGWDSIAIQPDAVVPSDGFFDSLAISAGLESGQALSGFSVTFVFLAGAAPGSQPFNIVDSRTFATLQTGFTETAGAIAPIPEPSHASLLLLGLVFMVARKLRPGRDRAVGAGDGS